MFFVKNVYQSTQPIAAGSVKSLRVVRVFPQTVETPPSRSITPLRDAQADRGHGAGRRRRIGGVSGPGRPAAARFSFWIDNGMAVMTMRSLVYLQPGETAGCVGCHESRHARARTVPPCRPAWQVHDLRPPAGPRYEGGLSFARTRPARAGPLLHRLPRAGQDRRPASTSWARWSR